MDIDYKAVFSNPDVLFKLAVFFGIITLWISWGVLSFFLDRKGKRKEEDIHDRW